MDYHGDGAAEDGVRPKLGTMPHTVMTAISCNSNSTLKGFQFGKHLALVILPVQINGRKELSL